MFWISVLGLEKWILLWIPVLCFGYVYSIFDNRTAFLIPVLSCVSVYFLG